jgi:hypothetical protein
MWFDKKNKSDLNDNSNETSTKNDAVLYLIMQRRRNSAVKGTGNSFGQVK